jgi:hypothetical protein
MNTLRLVVVAVVISASLFAQTETPFSNGANPPQADSQPNPPQKNPQALALLARMMATTRWSALIRDAVAEGTMTNASDPSAPTRRFTLKMRGRDDYRYDAADGSSSMVLSGLAGALVRGDRVTRLPVHVAGDRGFFLPMLSLLADSAASDVDLASGDAQEVNGVACTEVKLTRRFTDGSALSKIRARIGDATVCISAVSLPLRVRHTRAALDNQTALFEETILYSDFRSVNGALVPFKQQIFLEGQPTSTVQFDSIELNAGPGDDIFRIPAVANAGGAQ